MIKQIAAINLALGAMGSIILFFIMNQNVAITCLATSILLVGNLMGLYFFWRIIFFKKSIALGLLIIIFKYPLIAFCLWQMSKQTWAQPLGIFVSLLLFIIGIVGVVLYNQRRSHAF